MKIRAAFILTALILQVSPAHAFFKWKTCTTGHQVDPKLVGSWKSDTVIWVIRENGTLTAYVKDGDTVSVSESFINTCSNATLEIYSLPTSEGDHSGTSASEYSFDAAGKLRIRAIVHDDIGRKQIVKEPLQTFQRGLGNFQTLVEK